MNRSELIAKIAEAMGTTKKAAGEALDSVFGVIAKSLEEGTNVKVNGFGTFKVSEVAERTGIIQMGEHKGETYVTPAHNKVSFKAATQLKDAVK